MTTPDTDTRIASAQLESGAAPYAQTIRLGRHAISSDEPAAAGGADAGPAPYALLLAALGSCTSITLQMYAGRKGWAIGAVHVDLEIVRDAAGAERIERTVTLAGEVTAEQRARLAEIAEKTPVTKTIARGTPIHTRFP